MYRDYCCPNCSMPIAGDADMCPHCHVTEDSLANPSYAILFAIIVLIFFGIFAYDFTHGTRILPSVWRIFSEGN